jgi:processive 1,2-diacylglycerol beta-glucosyltransferase
MKALMVSASIGEGHDAPARLLAAALEERGARAEILDALSVAGPIVQHMAGAGTQYDSHLGNVLFDVMHPIVAERPRSQRATARLIGLLAGERVLAAVARARPDVVVSTYPGATAVLGRLRRERRLAVPLASAVTDLASLRWWVHPGVDCHLLIHAESAVEVHGVAGADARAVAVHGLTDPRFQRPLPRADARACLGLPTDGSLAVVSGGGWAVGDLRGAVDAALDAGAASIVVLCGRRDDVRAALGERYAARPQVALWSFTDQMPEVLAAADVLVHSTAGLTVLEALMCGCRVISYGWGRGHIRANNRAYAQLGLAAVATDRAELATELRAALAAAPAVPLQPDLPEAADVVLGLVVAGTRPPTG